MQVLLKSKKTDMIRSLSGILSISTIMMFLFVSSSFSQSRKEIKKYGIRSTESVITEFVGGKEVTHTDSFEKYDNDGNIIEEVEYNKDGTFKKKYTRKYNKAGEITEEVKYDAKGAIVSKVVTAYNESNDKVNEQTYDGTGKLVEWFKYGYNDLGEKTFELSLDEKGKTIRKSLYVYDKNGLRKERKTFNGRDELIAVKKYNYKIGNQ